MKVHLRWFTFASIFLRGFPLVAITSEVSLAIVFTSTQSLGPVNVHCQPARDRDP